ncbi:MAG: hydrogenase expression/formation protein HypE [Desulfonauticus sp.]|nr:hydrogenase expression/formation protein HypE [Desulfonauticus sp.]
MGKLLLDYGSGGKASYRLIKDIFLKYLGNIYLNKLDDAVCLEQIKSPVVMSTDSYTVDPIIFPGGDIGSLAVHGTVNDVAMLGARPKYLSCGFILEEGLDLALLEQIVCSMAKAAARAKVLVVTGDTKVVPKGAVDKIFINTTGLGELMLQAPLSGASAKPGDVIILSGTIGDHGLTILSRQKGISFDTKIKSDSAPLNVLIEKLLNQVPEVHVLRDPTRGGLATTLNEIARQSQVCCLIEEKLLPIKEEVRGGCAFLGLDPLYLANEGKFVLILPEQYERQALDILKQDELGKDACVIGKIQSAPIGKVVLQTTLGGQRLLDMLEGEQLPRIC